MDEVETLSNVIKQAMLVGPMHSAISRCDEAVRAFIIEKFRLALISTSPLEIERTLETLLKDILN